MKQRTYVFVYGTLMNGMEASDLLAAEGARLVGRGRIEGRLVDLGEFPGAVHSSNTRDAVVGEVYELPSQAALRQLDHYEEYSPNDPGRSLFVRENVRAELLDGSGQLNAWTYFYNEEEGRLQARRIPSGDYRSYRRRTVTRR